MSSLASRFSRGDEFPAGAAEWPRDLSRRDFLQLMAASLALGGLTACTRRAAETIVPRVVPDLGAPAGGTAAFATVMSSEGFARGVLVTTRDGRPTKIEGNPDHPESLGATDAVTQAAILSLYDPARSRVPLRQGQPSTWAAFEAEWRDVRADLVARRGAGLALLTEPTTSPTQLRELHRLLDTLPAARWFQHTPLARFDADSTQADFDFARAEVIFSIQSDCFYRHPAALRYGRALAARRRVENGRVAPPRFYAIEPTPSVTGALADFRLPASPARLRLLLDAIARALGGGDFDAATLGRDEAAFVRALAVDIAASPGRVACIAGPESDSDIRAWADALNALAGADVTRALPPLRSDGDRRCTGDLAELARALDRGEVRELFLLGVNPAYAAPHALDFGRQLRRVAFTAHFGEFPDETAACCRWHLPESHFLETWSDLRAFGGSAALQQPLIEPLHASRSLAELVRLIGDGATASAYDLVRETWRGTVRGADFELRWHRWLERGVIDDEPSREAPAPAARKASGFPTLARAAASPALTLVLQPDPVMLDGRWAGNAWLQELPKPLTHLVWDNAALVSPQLAAELRLANGDLIACALDGAALEAPVWIMPGQASGAVTLTLGYGRTHAGAVGSGRGYDAYRLRTTAAPWQRDGLVVRRLGRRHPLVSTQNHFAIEGRDLVRVLTPAAAGRVERDREPPPSLYPAWKRDRYAWGMSIDLGTCLGCNACIVACQAENNIPVVGREQVARGRAMHWLRVDTYLLGDAASPRFVSQPVPCMQCENAPCELVCPVAATVHSSEGLNDMVYNRCIGTRYCSNNCPYKVRRFNFLDYRAPRDSTVFLQANPDVSVRERGVMEKCTYCVQRINAARIAAEKENRAIRDGEVRTACQQACPAEAIVFGDLNDPASRVARRKREPLDYALLEELNTRPRTTYLAAVRHAPAT